MKYIYGEGPLDAKIMIIGEAPGAEEEIQGRPFVGQAGKALDKVLDKLGINRKDCYITNVVKIRPEDNRTPTTDEIDDWRDTLIEEIKHYNPKVIITLGNTALKGVLGKGLKVSKLRGKELKGYNYNQLIVPTYHPSYIRINPKLYDTWVKDFKLALDLSKQ